MKIFLGILMFFLVFGWLVLLLAATGLFYFGTVLLSILVSLALAAVYFPKISQNIGGRTDKFFYLVIAVSLLASFATCYFATPTVFGGRDQGSIATAAINLSQNHNLKIQNPIAEDLFQKYGPGKALNFPGFDYTKNGDLISRFPLGYTACLAGAYDLLGLNGIQYSNFIPLFLFLVIFWLILKEFFEEKIAFLGFLMAATFFPFLWFAKFALTETYMLFLVWAGIYFLFLSLRGAKRQSNPEPYNNSRDCFSSLAMTTSISLALFALSALTRIEGIAFFLLAAIYILLLQRKNILELPKKFKKYLLLSTLVLLGLYVYLNFPDLVDSLKNLAKAFLPSSAKESAPSANLYSYLARIFFNYNLFVYLLLGLAGIAWALFLSLRGAQRRGNPEPDKNTGLLRFARNDSLIPILITFPAFFYLLSPMITLDDPWLLRRFVFAVFPALLFYSIYALQKFFYHKIFLYIVLTVLIAANALVSWRFFTISENKDLLLQIEKISQRFQAGDLVLVDRMATGSGYSLASEPLRTLYGINAVYFMNAGDLSYINQNRYKNIYLLAPLMSEENPWYANLVKDQSPIGAQIISNNFLEPPDKKWALAQNVTAEELVGIWKIR